MLHKMKRFTIIAITILTTALASCTKVVNIDLNSAAPKLVVEANINDQPGPYYVHLSRTVNFDKPNDFPAATGAKVVISDLTAGITDTLTESSPGWYQTHTINGVSGHTYQLMITADNNTFSSSATMPALVPFDSLYTENFSAFGGVSKNVIPVYTDPEGVKNFYRFIEVVNGKRIENIYVRDDDRADGLRSTRPIFNDEDDIKTGDTLVLEMQCIDKGVYTYFNSMDEASTGSGNSIPANPVNNITGGALGYFSTYTTQSKKIVVP